MQEGRIQEILAAIRNVKVAVYGDFCLDAYWLLDPRGSEVSLETGRQGHAVAGHHYSLGGAANVVANLAALEPAAIQAIGVTGNDLYGRELRRLLGELRVDMTHLLLQAEQFDTVTFAKPQLDGQEQSRWDFGFFNRRSSESDRILLEGIESALQSVDVLIVNQQVPGSIPDPSFIERANDLFRRYPERTVLLDSRHYGHLFEHVLRKTNEGEAARLNGIRLGPEETPPRTEVERYAHSLFERCRRPVFITRGPRGLLARDDAGIHDIPGIRLSGEIDPVGAGDTVLSALALCLGAGVSGADTAAFANLAAAVTVQKRLQTGTATPNEIERMNREADYRYAPQLATHPEEARTLENSAIEVCAATMPSARVTHCLFDHDGTISTLRQGWDGIMASMMVEAILDRPPSEVDDALQERVRRRVLAYIDQSSGLQTLLQMEALVDMVREFGIVPEAQISGRFAYKATYNEQMLEVVRRRLARVNDGRAEVADFRIRGAVDLLQALRHRNVTLYLASGTDHEDVVNEAKALGYADLFNGGIYGAVGDITRHSKKRVIERILATHRLRGPQLAVFGDGPVEIREAREQGAWAIGVASDELNRRGVDERKRTRLIEAGAHLICGDFSEQAYLVDYLTRA